MAKHTGGKVKLHCSGGEHGEPYFVEVDSPRIEAGLAITPEIADSKPDGSFNLRMKGGHGAGWNITHIATGLAINQYYLTKKRIFPFFDELLAIAPDWSDSPVGFPEETRKAIVIATRQAESEGMP